MIAEATAPGLHEAIDGAAARARLAVSRTIARRREPRRRAALAPLV